MSAIIRRRGLIGANDGKLWIVKDGILQNSFVLTNQSLDSVSYKSGYIDVGHWGGGGSGTAFFTEMDFTNYNYLCANISAEFSTPDYNALLALYTAKFQIKSSSNGTIVKTISVFTNRPAAFVDRDVNANISNITGMNSIVLYIFGGSWRSSHFKIKNLWLEK